ncbi:MAG: MarR family transcriptional regulator, partial [Phycisphaerae bacterium]
MRFLRQQMRRHRRMGLTVPQFRALIFVSHNGDASLTAMADHIGISTPAASRMVELLVRRGLMRRLARPNDRRCVSLSLTPRGKAAFRKALRATQVALARRFEKLSKRELAVVSGAMEILGRLFVESPDAPHGHGRTRRRIDWNNMEEVNA